MFHHNAVKREGFSAEMNYMDFLKRKEITIENTGFDPDELNPNLFDFQRDIVSVSGLHRHSSAIRS